MRLLSLLFFLLFSVSAVAGYRHGITTGIKTQKFVMDVGGASTFAGTGYDYPFINVMKTWDSVTPSASTFNYPAILDANGYPTSLAGGSLAGTFAIPPSQTTSTDDWVIRWDGKLGTTGANAAKLLAAVTITSDAGGCVNSFSVNFQFGGTSCRIVFRFTSPQQSVNFTFNGGASLDGTLNGLAIYKLSNETAYNAGVITDPNFKAKINALRPGTSCILRPLDWSNTNNSSLAIASQKIPVGSLTYSQWWNPTVVASSVGYSKPGAVDLYTATVAGILSLTDGVTFHAQITTASTANTPTMNLNSLGAINVNYVNGSSLFVGNGGSGFALNSFWTFTYNSVRGIWMAAPTTGSQGVPIEAQIQVANEIGCNLWVLLPVYATNALATSYATTVKATLNNTAYFGFANEIWNFGVTDTDYSAGQGGSTGLNFPNASFGSLQQITDFYALRFRETMGIVASIYGAQSNYRRVLEWQAFGNVSQTVSYRWQGQDLDPTTNATLCSYLGFAGNCAAAPNYSQSPNRPIDFADKGSYAGYVSAAQAQGPEGGNYVFLDSSKTINGATNANPVVFQTSTAHGYSTGQRVKIGANFTGTWTPFNSQSYTVTVTDTTHFSVPVDTSNTGTFVPYSANGGSVSRYSDEFFGLVAAADAFANTTPIANACNGLTTAVDWVDCDLNAGTNYGVIGNATVSAFKTNIIGPWETAIVPFGKNIIWYEGALSMVAPAAGVCTNYGVSSTYCGGSGLIANLLGVGPSASSLSYRMSPQFQATMTSHYSNFLAKAHSEAPSQYLLGAGQNGNAWQAFSGDLYSTPFSVYNAISGLP